jgi:hypothetical protein
MAKAQTEDDTQVQESQGILDESGEGFTFDMTQQEADEGFPVADAGIYDLSLDACEYKNSQSSGHPMWAMRFVITGPDTEVAAKKIGVRYYQSFKPDQMGRAKFLVQRLGREDLLTADFNPKKIADDAVLVGATTRARLGVRNDPQYGKSNEIKAFLPAGAEGGQSGGGGFSM